MASTEQTTVVLSGAEADRRALAAEMAAMKDNPITETVPGGRYLNAGGDLVDAHGKVIEGAKGSEESESEPTAKSRRR